MRHLRVGPRPLRRSGQRSRARARQPLASRTAWYAHTHHSPPLLEWHSYGATVLTTMRLTFSGRTPRSTQNDATCEVAWFRISATHPQKRAWSVLVQLGFFGMGVDVLVESDLCVRLV